MPHYTAKISMFSNNVQQEDIWLEKIHAFDSIAALKRAHKYAASYIQAHKHEANPITSFHIEFCDLTSSLDKRTVKQNALLLPAPSSSIKPKHKPSTEREKIKIPKKLFKGCITGSFKDPYKFAKNIKLSVVTEHRYEDYRGYWHENYYDAY